MMKRTLPLLALLCAFALITAAPVAAQSGGAASLPHAGRTPRPGRGVGFSHGHAARAARGVCRQGVPDGGGSRRLRAGTRAREQRRPQSRGHDDRNRAVVNGTRESADLRLAYNDFWWDRGTTAVETRRTSLVVDPSDGQLPALTDTGAARRRETARISQRAERRSRGPLARGALHHRIQLRPADVAGGVQHERADLPDRRPCGHSQRDGAQRAHRPARQQ